MYKIVPLNSLNYWDVVHETSPELPSARDLSIQEEKCQSNTLLYRVAAVSESGQMLGYGRIVSGPWDPGTKAGHFSFALMVAKEWRLKGIGRAVYDNLMEFSKVHGAKVLTTFVNESEPYHLEWMERLGYRCTRHTFSSQLDLTKFGPFQFRDAIEAVQAAGFTFATLGDYPDNDEIFTRFIEFFFKLANDSPHADALAFPDPATMKHLLKDVMPWEPLGVQLVLHEQRWVAMSVVRAHSGR